MVWDLPRPFGFDLVVTHDRDEKGERVVKKESVRLSVWREGQRSPLLVAIFQRRSIGEQSLDDGGLLVR